MEEERKQTKKGGQEDRLKKEKKATIMTMNCTQRKVKIRCVSFHF